MNDSTVTLVKASDVRGLPVVTIDGGDDSAEIKDVVYDAVSHTLIGFTLNKRGWFRGSMKAVLQAGSVEAIGPDAVMVMSDAALSDTTLDTLDSDVAVLDTPKQSYDIMGNTVISSAGVELGQVVDVIIEAGADPRAAGYEVVSDQGSVFVPSSAQLALSGENLVVPAEADDFIANDLTGFGASVASFRRLIESGATS